MRKTGQYAINCLFVVSTLIVFNSCSSTKHVTYFRDIPDSVRQALIQGAPYKDPLIMPDDILSVTIVTLDPTTTLPVNQTAASAVPSGGLSSSLGSTSTPGISPSAVSATPPVQGLLVDKNGNISLPILGVIKVGGLSTSDAKIEIQKLAEKYYKDPDVQIRYVNFKITVIGEVAHPSTYIVPSEKVSILDAIGMAGDLTIYGVRGNVMLIRDENGVKHVERLDLNSSSLFKSPYFYLKQNDVVYVEPNKSKAVQADAEQTRFIEIAATVATGILLLVRYNQK